MKGYIRHLGVIDHSGRVHAVTFGPGVNVVTGKSSTGKSALIEIFDWCMGSSERTIPEGVITSSAAIYFTVMRVHEKTILLARRKDSSQGYIEDIEHIEEEKAILDDPNQIRTERFQANLFKPLPVFKKDVGRRFGLAYTDVDTDPDARSYRRNNARAATPSIRSFTSFMLQHQNLVANKHAIFYRFDEKEKREQVIDHLKCFLGFAKPEYFQLKQELEIWDQTLKSLEAQKKREDIRKGEVVTRIQIALDDFSAASGKKLSDVTAAEIATDPAGWLKRLSEKSVEFDGASDENRKLRRQLQEGHSETVLKQRDANRRLAQVSDSILHLERFRNKAEAVPEPTEAVIQNSVCLFCGQSHAEIEHEADQLEEAVQWLNSELDNSLTVPPSLVELQRGLNADISALNGQIREFQRRMKELDAQDAQLAQKRSHYELAVKAKVMLEAALESIGVKQQSDLEAEITDLRQKMGARKAKLKEEFDVESKMKEAGRFIDEFMSEWGPKFEFEEWFRPINLRFSLESFDLWHENPEGKEPEKVHLRAMGSGANWLYSHLTLFLALHRLFCHCGKECSIPPILMLDQPSQVYFPTVLDKGEDFDAEAIRKDDKTRAARSVDEDIKAVTNMFSVLVEFCEDTLDKEGIEPQIIVTDHADGLELQGDRTFESLVNGHRWRTRGLIHPVG